MKKTKIVLALCVICAGFACASKTQLKVNGGKVWAGIGYVASKSGEVSAEASASIAVIGVVDAAAWGFGVGMVAGPAGGAIAGIAAGL